jgi:hypothetical protein
MTKALLRSLVAGIGLSIVGLSALTFSAADAGEVPKAVKRACRGDYFAYCSMHRVGSPELRQCMRDNGKRLSRGCVDALVAAGLAPKSKKTKVAATR